MFLSWDHSDSNITYNQSTSFDALWNIFNFVKDSLFLFWNFLFTKFGRTFTNVIDEHWNQNNLKKTKLILPIIASVYVPFVICKPFFFSFIFFLKLFFFILFRFFVLFYDLHKYFTEYMCLSKKSFKLTSYMDIQIKLLLNIKIKTNSAFHFE